MKHIVNVTISNPAHDFVSMRSRQSTTNYMVEAKDEAEAILRASRHFKSLGHYVHNAVIVEQNLNEEVEQIDEISDSLLRRAKNKADYNKMNTNDSATFMKNQDHEDNLSDAEDKRSARRRRLGIPDDPRPAAAPKKKLNFVQRMIKNHKDEREAGERLKRYVRGVNNEEVEQIDELKKSTLASYATKAARNIRTSHSLAKSFDDDHTAAIRKVLKNSPNVDPHKGHIRSPAEKAQGELEMKATADLRDKFKRRAQNRITGIGRAAAKLAKEETDKMPVAPVPGDKWKSHAVMVHPETKQRVVVARKNAKNYPESDGWKEVGPGMRLKKEEVEQVDEAGIMKKVRRSLAGWGAFDKDKPKDVVKNTRSMSNDALSQIAIPRKNTLKSSPAALQQKVAKRELAKRNMGEEVVDEKAPPGKEKMVKDIKKAYSKDGVLTDKEKAIAYATAWKAKNAGK